ncbi:MAG: hypothetical protein WBX78_01365 [Pseudolabrys sp.]
MDIITGQPKGVVEGSACGNDAKLLVEHYERIADGIDDGICERNSVLDVGG